MFVILKIIKYFLLLLITYKSLTKRTKLRAKIIIVLYIPIVVYIIYRAARSSDHTSEIKYYSKILELYVDKYLKNINNLIDNKNYFINITSAFLPRPLRRSWYVKSMIRCL